MLHPNRERRLNKLRQYGPEWFRPGQDDLTTGAMIETAFLMAAADGEFGEDEQGEVNEALLLLTGGQLTMEQIDQVIDQLLEALRRDGWEQRIAAVAESLPDPTMRRSAYRLAAGISFVDGQIQEEEAKLFGLLGEAFGIGTDEASLMLVEVRDVMFRGNSEEETVSDLPPQMRRGG
jgi:hypothetical protein